MQYVCQGVIPVWLEGNEWVGSSGPRFHRARSGVRREGHLRKAGSLEKREKVTIPFHSITLPPSRFRFGPSKASHSSFPTPPTLDAVHPRAVEENIITYSKHQKTIKQNHCQPDRLTRGICFQMRMIAPYELLQPRY